RPVEADTGVSTGYEVRAAGPGTVGMRLAHPPIRKRGAVPPPLLSCAARSPAGPAAWRIDARSANSPACIRSAVPRCPASSLPPEFTRGRERTGPAIDEIAGPDSFQTFTRIAVSHDCA